VGCVMVGCVVVGPPEQPVISNAVITIIATSPSTILLLLDCTPMGGQIGLGGSG
jgi:ABC-type methionine transport system permease subunit